MRKFLPTLALVVTAALLLAACGSSTTNGCPTSQPAALAAGEQRQIVMTTSMGEITLLVEAGLSPIAVGNFVALAECGFYDNVIFHRIAYMQDGTPFVIQGGDPTGTGTGGPGYKIKDEPVVGEYARGVLAMARSAAPDSQGSQFFIVLDDGAQPPLESARTYAILGRVTAGMDVVDAIAGVERDAEDRPVVPVTILSTTVSTLAP
ncbi:MAG: peptidylprolyl isomerase [Chloroflexi bacterium]|nr:MAG: peptidylprolyl isomerase [Chloroflexota bacterium]